MTLHSLFSPLTPDQFFAEYWGRRWLLQQGQPTRFAHLLSWADIDEILARQPTQLRLVKNGVLIPEANYVRSRGAHHLELRSARLMDELRQGATLVLDRIDQLHAPIRDLARALEWAAEEAVQVNLYASWGLTRGFDLHWDDHDVLVLHLLGSKAWKVCGMSRPHPIRKDRHRQPPFPPPTEPVWTGDLLPGDLLYLPRGWWHEVSAKAEPTAHLTFSIPKRNGFDFLTWLADGLVESEAFRQDLPRHATAEEKQQHHRRLQETLLQHFAAMTLDRFFESDRALVSAPPRFALPWQATDQAIPPGPDLTVHRALARSPLYQAHPDAATFSFAADGKRLELPLACRPVVEYILARESVGISEILSAPGITIREDHLRGLLGSLVKHSLVTVRPTVAS